LFGGPAGAAAEDLWGGQKGGAWRRWDYFITSLLCVDNERRTGEEEGGGGG